MKKISIFFFAFLLLQIGFAQNNNGANPPQTVIHVNNYGADAYSQAMSRQFGVRMLQALDTDNPDAFRWDRKSRGYYYGTSSTMSTNIIACVDHDIYTPEGALLILKGTPVDVEVRMKENRAPGIPAELRVRWLRTTDVNGNTVFLHGEFNGIGESKRGSAFGKAFGLGLTIMPGFGFLFLCIKGDEVVIPRNEYISNVTITPAPVTYPED